jgi:hypothetical protein
MIVAPAVAFSVAANSVSANLMAGNMFEYLERPSIVEFGLAASAVGLLLTAFLGSTIICQDQEISAANRYPVIPDDWILKAAAKANSKIFATLRNRTAGALNGWVILNITPVG